MSTRRPSAPSASAWPRARRGDWLAWDRIAAIGPDAVTIDSADRLEPYAADPSRRGLKANGAIGGRVLTDQGREVGSLSDVDLDDDGAMVSLLVGDRRVEADDLLGIGSYATVVRDTVDG